MVAGDDAFGTVVVVGGVVATFGTTPPVPLTIVLELGTVTMLATVASDVDVVAVVVVVVVVVVMLVVVVVVVVVVFVAAVVIVVGVVIVVVAVVVADDASDDCW